MARSLHVYGLMEIAELHCEEENEEGIENVLYDRAS
jgi:hypothetical protein